MKILLTNDDGIHAPGIAALCRQFSEQHDVTVVAPDRERSAVGHGITLIEPLRWAKVALNGCEEGYAVSGKPADCVKLGIEELVAARPDIVISGINAGANIGININYSGTVAAAREAVLYGIPAIAVSIQWHETMDYDGAARFTEALIGQVTANGLPFGTLLNVNFPECPTHAVAGIRISRQGINRLNTNSYAKRLDPRNRPYFWLDADMTILGDDLTVDQDALANNYITITPIRCDATDYATLDALSQWKISEIQFG